MLPMFLTGSCFRIASPTNALQTLHFHGDDFSLRTKLHTTDIECPFSGSTAARTQHYPPSHFISPPQQQNCPQNVSLSLRTLGPYHSVTILQLSAQTATPLTVPSSSMSRSICVHLRPCLATSVTCVLFLHTQTQFLQFLSLSPHFRQGLTLIHFISAPSSFGVVHLSAMLTATRPRHTSSPPAPKPL